MHFITLFESLTGATTRDCIVDERWNRLIFIVKPGDMGLAIGKGGINVKRLKRMLGKNIEVVEFSEIPEEFIKHSLSPARVRSVKITNAPDGRRIAYVTIEPNDKGIAIGREGKNIARARLIAKRYFDIDHVVVV